MSARTTEVVRVRSPIKKQIQHLDGKSQRAFPEILNEIVRRLRDHDFKLIHVTKSYREEDTICSDSFWKREKRIGSVKVVWLCTLTTIFDGGFEFKFDFDFWFEFSKFLQNLRGELYQMGFPFTLRSYAEKFGKKEATRLLEKVEKGIEKDIKEEVDGWGVHGVRKEVLDRDSLDICHRRIFKLESISELEKLREGLKEISDEPVELIEDSLDNIFDKAKVMLGDLVPFDIAPRSLEGFLALFLWFRDPGGGFEYQLYRFIQENYGAVDKREIRDALLRLEVHGYAKVVEAPERIKNNLREFGIRRCSRFYEMSENAIPGRKLFQELKSEVDLGAYLAPLPRKRLIKELDAQNHLVNKEIKKLTRKNFLSRRKVRDFSGRTVKKIKPRRNFNHLKGLERRIVEEAEEFYEVQKTSLDEMQEKRP